MSELNAYLWRRWSSYWWKVGACYWFGGCWWWWQVCAGKLKPNLRHWILVALLLWWQIFWLKHRTFGIISSVPWLKNFNFSTICYRIKDRNRNCFDCLLCFFETLYVSTLLSPFIWIWKSLHFKFGLNDYDLQNYVEEKKSLEF